MLCTTVLGPKNWTLNMLFVRALKSNLLGRTCTLCGCTGRSMSNKTKTQHGIMPQNTYYKYRYKQNLPTGIQKQKFQYFLVLDFEATCDSQFMPQMEIIEFPCLKVDAQTFEILKVFHEYIRPVKNPILTDFCSDLTGITQSMVDEGHLFHDTLIHFLAWMKDNDVRTCGSNRNAIFVTAGDWDLKTMLPDQCQLSNIPVPDEMKVWINIKQSFLKSTGKFPRGLRDMLVRLQMHQEGRLHSGIDDCRNIVNIMLGLANRAFVFEETGKS